MHLQCDGICNNRVIANCLQGVPVKKKFENWSIIGENMDKSKVPRFLAHSVYGIVSVIYLCYVHDLITMHCLVTAEDLSALSFYCTH